MTDKPDTVAIRAQMDALGEHTPGPWHVNGPKAMEIVGRIHRVLNPENYPAAFVPAWDQPEAGKVDGKDEAIANARLIAAAPDMRATILTLCDEMDRLRAENERLRAALKRIVSGKYDGLEVDHRTASECRQIARAALAQTEEG